VCSTAGDAERMLFCDSCDKAYHMSCHHPEVRVKPMGKWDCSACRCSSTTIGDIVAGEQHVMIIMYGEMKIGIC